MKRCLITICFLFAAITIYAQVYNNEWIDFSKTYYRFKVGSTGLYHINQPALTSIGLENTPAQQFQLWHNGKEISLYTSVPSGTLSASDYLEFYGEMNDGTADKPLYQYDSLQMTDHYSLLTDTSVYFLTVNNGINKRFINTANNVATNTLTAETGFVYSLQKFYRNKENPGYAADYGDLLYSSSYETGEGWTSNDIAPGSLVDNNNLYLNNIGGTAILDAIVAGNANYLRPVQIKMNGNIIADTLVNGYNIKRFHVTNIPLTTFNNGTANVEFVNAGTGSDKIVLAGYTLTYPRLFNFNNQSQFSFNMAPGPARYIEINNFNFGASAPVLLDLNNNVRLVGNIAGNMVRFVLPASLLSSSFVLLNSEPVNVSPVQNFVQRNFINYGLPSNQGNYVIISHPALYDDGAGNNNIDNYKQYRSSAPGGGFNVIVADVTDLIDQFAFGIKHHPLAIRNFGYYALANFSDIPQYFYLIGKGLTYPDFKTHEADPNIDKLAFVPTFGYPASDNLLLASRTGSYTQINIGRLSAINGVEVGDYLEKVKQFELVQNSGPQTNANKGWMKNVAQITGAINDESLATLINYFMDGYKLTMSDTSFGGKVYSFNKNSGLYTAAGSTVTIDTLFSQGLSFLTYFGHSSPNTLEFNLDNPQSYNNTGKYPLIMVNGCNSGNLFLFDTLRAISGGTLSEKYIFANEKGSIGFIADTHFGLPQQLDFFTSRFDANLSNLMYGQSIGNLMRNTMKYMSLNYSNDYASRIHEEEITYHGDPALKLNPFTKPDYTIEDSLVTFNPSSISIADAQVNITAKILNIGKAINDSLTILIQHQLPDNSLAILTARKIKATLYSDTIQFVYHPDPLSDIGTNKIIVTIDPGNLIPELSETNNSIVKTFTVTANQLRPVFPYEYSIVRGVQPLVLYGSTADPLSGEKQYEMQLDTTRLFNSLSMISKTVTDSGGVIQFLPNNTLIDSTVYYWRLSTGPADTARQWFTSSFTYIRNSSSDGYEQAHYFQYTDDSYDGINIDSSSRTFLFDNKLRTLLIRTGLYPYYDYDQINVNVDNDLVDLYGCLYNSLQFLVYDPLTLTPWRNYNVTPTSGRFGSAKVCQNSATTDTTRAFFEFNYPNAAARLNAMNFIDSIPNGYIVSVSNLGVNNNTSFINSWKADTAILGSGHSLWHKFHQLGLNKIDSFTTNLPFLFLFKKGDSVNFPVRQHIGSAINSQIADTFLLSGKEITGTVASPWLGPAKTWKDFKWDTTAASTANSTYFDIIGQDNDGNDNYLASVKYLRDTSLAFIDAAVYPKLQLRLNNAAGSNPVPAQLKYWMLTSDNYPEGALSPNLFFKCADSLTTKDSLTLQVAFINISNSAFDSLKVRLTITDANAQVHVFNNLANNARIKPLSPGDTAIISYRIALSNLPGNNKLLLEVNPDNDQPEQFHFNNVLYKNLYVTAPACAGADIVFSATGPAGTDQWQVNTGNGYVDIADGNQYSGYTTANLTIHNATAGMYGYKYRCVFTAENEMLHSGEFILKYTTLWTGGISTAWETPGNWSCGIIPDANTDVIIKAGVSNFPIIRSRAVCHSLSADTSTSILIKAGFNLTVGN